MCSFDFSNMLRQIISILYLLHVITANSQISFHESFVENFDASSPTFFSLSHINHDPEVDMRYICGSSSLTEKNTDVMIYRFDPDDPAGAGKGPEIISKSYTHYGSYSARLRIPRASKVQPNVGAVVGYFTYNMEKEFGLSEIDWEWLIADPHIVYIGTWTGKGDCLQRIGRTIDLAQGKILNTIYRSPRDGNINHQLSGMQNQPELISAIEGYDASSQFYVYGFDWYPNRLTWWIIHPETQEKVVLWDYSGSTPDFTGIPTNKTRYRLNFWHTNNWSVETNPNSTEKPKYPYEVEIDWMSYKPFKQ